MKAGVRKDEVLKVSLGAVHCSFSWFLGQSGEPLHMLPGTVLGECLWKMGRRRTETLLAMEGLMYTMYNILN